MNSSVPAHLPKPPTPDWRARCNLARSILSQREASALAARLATAALAGASVDALRTIDEAGGR